MMWWPPGQAGHYCHKGQAGPMTFKSGPCHIPGTTALSQHYQAKFSGSHLEIGGDEERTNMQTFIEKFKQFIDDHTTHNTNQLAIYTSNS